MIQRFFLLIVCVITMCNSSACPCSDVRDENSSPFFEGKSNIQNENIEIPLQTTLISTTTVEKN